MTVAAVQAVFGTLYLAGRTREQATRPHARFEQECLRSQAVGSCLREAGSGAVTGRIVLADTASSLIRWSVMRLQPITFNVSRRMRGWLSQRTTHHANPHSLNG